LRVRREAVRLLAVALLVALLFPVRLARADNDSEKATLRGIRGVRVIVEEVDPAIRQMISESDLQQYLELKLRREGVRVYTESEWLEDSNGPLLAVQVTAMPIVQGGVRHAYAVNVDLDFVQTVTLARAGRSVTTLATTWDTGALQITAVREVADARWAGELLDGVGDRFLNAWLSTHPKR
jgi:hypothetical protein